MMQLRDYQVELAQQGHKILAEKGIVYLAAQVRTGKTLTALEIARLFGAKNVLFLTKKKAIPSIVNDFNALLPGYNLVVINNESLPSLVKDEIKKIVKACCQEEIELLLNLIKLNLSKALKFVEYFDTYCLPKICKQAMQDLSDRFDLVINDENHRHGSFPKPGKGVRLYRELFYNTPQIWLSGTPCPESYSQIYHQFWVSKHSPFPEPNFYKWAHKYVNIKQRVLPQGTINDYSDARLDEISPIIEPYMIRFTQAQAGFVNQIDEEILWVPQPQIVKDLTKRIIADGVIVGKNHTISADGAAALQQKVHQIHSGTILFDPVEGDPRASMTLSNFKVDFIRDRFAGQKVVIFYKFTAEGKALLAGLRDAATNDIDEFRSTNKSIVLQIVSGREGLNLSEAEAIVYYNIDFSALSFWQSRDRLTTMERRYSKVYWVFGEGGIEGKIYKMVLSKKSYTTNIFKKDFGINARARHSSQSNPQVSEGRVLRSATCAS